MENSSVKDATMVEQLTVFPKISVRQSRPTFKIVQSTSSIRINNKYMEAWALKEIAAKHYNNKFKELSGV